MKVVEKNCVKKPSKELKRKNMAVMGEKNYISSIPNVLIEVIRSPGNVVNISLKK